LAVIGANGLGKSTLLKIIMERLKADQGKIRLGHEVRLGYFAQDHHELLGSDKQTPLDFIWEACPAEGTATVRGMLGRVLFSGDDVTKPVGSLSGGEAARLIFCKIIAEKPNVLVLDEPTNHLDLEAIAALVQGLKAFEGTVIFVSHDRSFVSELATRILEVASDGPREFSGTYAEYLARAGDDHLDIDAVSLKAKTANATSGGNKPLGNPPGLSWEEQKKRRNRLGTLPSRRDKLLAQIELAEARKKAIADSYTGDGFFERSSAAEIQRLETESLALGKQIEAALAEWETVEAEIAKISNG
jgi:ABC-type multidrug transport system ATPase subunit